MFFKKALAVGILAAPVLAMTGCGGDNSALGSTPSNTQSAALTLSLTDGPIDSATAVVVEITGVSIKPKEGDVIRVTFDAPKSIDLLQLQDGVVTDLVNELALEPGEYAWVQVHLNAAKDGVMDSYIEFEDGTAVELDMPGDAAQGLRIARSFTLAEGENAAFTIDFDLRKSLFRDALRPEVRLKPALHMVQNRRAGKLRGEVDADLVTELCADPSVELGAVYVFPGADATPTDVNGSDSDPIASALVKLKDDGEYRYKLGFLEAGDYTVAYTCDAASDNPDEVNELTFAVLEPITIEARKEHEHPFPKGVPYERWDDSVCDRILNPTEPADEAADDDTTSEPAEMEASRSVPTHLLQWCESDDHQWHPRPGRGEDDDQDPPVEEPSDPEMPMPPVDGPDRPKPPMADDHEHPGDDHGVDTGSDDEDSAVDEDEEEDEDETDMSV